MVFGTFERHPIADGRIIGRFLGLMTEPATDVAEIIAVLGNDAVPAFELSADAAGEVALGGEGLEGLIEKLRPTQVDQRVIGIHGAEV